MANKCSVVVLISGNGSNLQALINASADGQFEITGVISNNPTAYGLERARKNSIPVFVVDHHDFTDRESFDQALIMRIDQIAPDLIVLAGFMRILSSAFVEHYATKVLNIHPSLLPKYPGTNTHQRVLDAGDDRHGASVHFVTEELDGGPIAAYADINVAKGDTAETLREKVHKKEHSLYPFVVGLFAAGRLRMKDCAAGLTM
jgi:phosphoribosylglycinamide formyltransferase-1